MSSDEQSRWPRVKEIFSTALARAPDRRAAFLREVCGEDAALRGEVESLLAAHAQAGSFAEGVAIDALTALDAASVNVPAMAVGTELGPYRVVASLDVGGMGEVYRALDTRLDRDVAVKVLPRVFCDDPERVARLAREARLLAALNHPHIATIHGLEIAGGQHAIVMELVEGPTLADRLRHGPLALEVALQIAHQIADALEAAHDRGIIHRDLKPANIKLTATGAVKVLDFGLAKAAEAQASRAYVTPHGSRAPRGEVAISTAGVVTGTPGYMSPEQARGEYTDARSDVWAFGCVLFEMLTGRSAFGRETAGDTLAASLRHGPDWEQLPAIVPPGIRRLLRRCLERDPRRRLHHIADARIEIEDVVHDPDAPAARNVTSSLRHRAFLVSAAALALVLGVVSGMRFLAAPREMPEPRLVDIVTPRATDPWSFAISPDGRLLAFVADHEGQPALWVRALDSAGAHALPGTEGARRPFWSPDSRSIGFFQNSEMKRIEARGGAVQAVTYALAGMTASWGTHGTILFSSNPDPSLWRVNASGGTAERVTKPGRDSAGDRHPQFLADSQQFLFFKAGPDAVRGIYLGSLGSPDVTRLVLSDTQGAFVAPGWLLFIRQGTLRAQRLDVARRMVSGEPVTIADSVAFEPVTGLGAFSISNAGAMTYRVGGPAVTQLSWLDRQGNAVGKVAAGELTGLSNVRLSPDGRRVAVERTMQNETDLWLLSSTHQTRFTHASEASIERLPLWAPDGQLIAFESVRSGTVALSVKPVSGQSAEQVLFESPQTKIPTDWSPDGQFLMYYVPDAKTGTDIWVLPRDTHLPRIFLRTDANELWGTFSPDGRWVAYQSNETGRYEIYVRSFTTAGGAVPVSSAGGVYPRWSHDGKELYFIAPNAKLMAASIRSTTTTLEPGEPIALFQTQKVGGGQNMIGRSHQYDVAPDGRFLVLEADSSAPPITLLLNWKW